MRPSLQAIVYMIFAGLCTSFCISCNNFETEKRGSWEHYAAGGMLQIGLPTMTDDGQLFFVSGATGHGDIYCVDIATSQTRRITFSEYFEGSPVVADDGSFLFFSREVNGKASVFSLDLRSNAENRITDGNSFDEPVATLQNASFLLVSRKQESFAGHGQIVSYWLSSVRRHTDPSTRRIGDFAVADSSGSHLAVLDDNSIWHLTGKDFEDKSQIEAPFDAFPLAISSDGFHLVLAKQASAGEWEFDSDLYLIEIESSNICKIGKGHSPVVEKNGTLVIFYTGYDNLLQQFVTATQTSNPIGFEGSFKSNLRLVEQGASAVFASVTDNRADNYEIFKIPLDSLQPIRLFSVNSAAIKKEFDQ